MSNKGKESKGEDHARKRAEDPLLKIVKRNDPKADAKDTKLDLSLDDFDGDHRYGREDIADK
ncbi:MAG: hypothetical protein IPH13_09555 [Planctomycetes bacterium]|nr:hypothetical protein [Planctomycetota bacterium]MCC7168922.1 hypothetical protein [Planctomycetota bacterium]